MAVTINITRQKIFSIAEGISVTISQHNGGTPTFEQLWASTDEAKKLDIYYREAVADLEQNLMRWVLQASSQFDLSTDGTDYTLVLTMNRYWPSRLEGLLDNTIQNYIVHAVTAGWLNDFEGLNVKADYVEMAAQELKDIREIILQRSFGFDRSERAEDTDEKNDPGSIGAEERNADGTEKEDPGSIGADARSTDGTEKEDPGSIEAGKRNQDKGKDTFVLPFEARYRKQDDVRKNDDSSLPPLAQKCTARHHDNAPVRKYPDWTDASGTGLAYGMMPGIPPHFPPVTRPMMGTGFTPQHKPKPHKPMPPKKPKLAPNAHKLESPMPDCNMQTIIWQDPDKYNKEREEKFINSHDCGHHDCGHHGINELDWDFNDEESNDNNQ